MAEVQVSGANGSNDSVISVELMPKRLELLSEPVPQAGVIAASRCLPALREKTRFGIGRRLADRP